MLTTSGVTMNGFVEHEQHLEEVEGRKEFIFDENGYPVLNLCGNLRMVFPDSDEVQDDVQATQGFCGQCLARASHGNSLPRVRGVLGIAY